MNNSDSLIKVTIEDIIDLIREGKSAEILYEDAPYPTPNVITIVCEDKYCNDIREIKPIISTHSPTQIYIRSMDKDKVITSWKEFYVHSARIYIQFKIDHTLGAIQVEQKENELDHHVEVNGKSLAVNK